MYLLAFTIILLFIVNEITWHVDRDVSFLGGICSGVLLCCRRDCVSAEKRFPVHGDWKKAGKSFGNLLFITQKVINDLVWKKTFFCLRKLAILFFWKQSATGVIAIIIYRKLQLKTEIRKFYRLREHLRLKINCFVIY